MALDGFQISKKKFLRKYQKEELPIGWVEGRYKWRINSKKCRNCGIDISDTASQYCSKICKISHINKRYNRKYKNGFEVEVDNVKYDSISMAADANNIGHETARMRFKSKNFPTWKILGS